VVTSALRQRLKPRVPPTQQGALLVEALVVSVVVTIALLGTIGVINTATQQRTRTEERNQLNAAIDADLAAITDLASQLTCCSGTCTLGIPGGTTPGPNSPCATDNRRDDRYFFPQLDDPATTAVREPEAIDTICQEPTQGIISDDVLGQFNGIPLNDDLTPSGGVRQPIVRLRTVEDQPGNQNILQVTYTDNNAADPNAPVRVARVVPPMARFCP
jgi:type II secretory pathway pseudopilin PulG